MAHSHRAEGPPVDIILFHDTPPPEADARPSTSLSASFPSMPFSRMNSNPPLTGALTIGSLPREFRLQPRGKAVACTPSPSGGNSTRGRKRRAQCISATKTAQDTIVTNGNLFTSSPGAITETENSSSEFSAAPAGAVASKYQPHSPISTSTSTPPRFQGINSTPNSPSFERALQCLSIRSPQQLSTRSVSSSFSPFSGSPSGTSVEPQMRSRSTSIGSSQSVSNQMHHSSPSSQRSSPRFAPIRVIQHSADHPAPPEKSTTKDAVGPGFKRPPLHTGIMTGSSHHNEESSAPQKKSSPLPVFGSPKGDRPQEEESAYFDSPATNKSPKISLPKISLTPKRTPKDEYSPIMGTPEFLMPNASASSQSNGGVEASAPFLPHQNMLEGSGPIGQGFSLPPNPPTLSRRTQKQTEDPFLNDFAGFDVSVPSRSQKTSSYLPFPDWCDNPVNNSSRTTENSASSPSSFFMETGEDSKEENQSKIYPGFKATSLLYPPKSGGFLQSLMAQEANDADGSLTDEDDDDLFVLTVPGDMMEERRSSLQSRQRPRLEVNTQHSSASLNSGLASNTSLLGMNFLRNDSSTSMTGQDSSTNENASGTAMSELSDKKRRCGNDRSSSYSNLSKIRSEASLSGSVGLALDMDGFESRGQETLDDPNRNFETPPPENRAVARPDGPSSSMDEEKNETKTEAQSSSVCISSADPSALTLAIAQMEYQASSTDNTSI